jgi:acyl-CoA thioester hydrolase
MMKNMATQNEFNWPVRVYYEDTDAAGVVYYANYLRYLERARTEFLRSHGFEQDELKRQGIIFAVHSVSIEYRKPAVFNDMLSVGAKVTELARASVTFQQNIMRQSDQTLISSAVVKMACIDANQFIPTLIPEAIREAIGGN